MQVAVKKMTGGVLGDIHTSNAGHVFYRCSLYTFQYKFANNNSFNYNNKEFFHKHYFCCKEVRFEKSLSLQYVFLEPI
jgi:hypothetical protein